MFKKVLYIIAMVMLGYLVYYFSWITVTADHVMSKAKIAAKNDDKEFFLKWFTYYDDDTVYSNTFNNNGISSKMDVYKAYHKGEDDSIFTFIITKLDGDITYDKNSDSKKTQLTIYSGEKSMSINYSNYSYDDLPIIQFDFYCDDIYKKLSIYDDKGTEDTADDTLLTPVSKITKIVLTDAYRDEETYKEQGKVIFEASGEQLFSFTDETKDEWKVSADANLVKLGYTDAQYKKNFYYHYPTMWKVWRNLIIFVVVAVGLGLLLFWPRKNKFEKTFLNKEHKTE